MEIDLNKPTEDTNTSILRSLPIKIHYKKCSKCKKIFPRTHKYFRWRLDQKDFRASCRFCDKKHYKNNREVYSKRNYRWQLKIKKKVLGHYSPVLKCQKCGFDDLRALSLDHINGGGNRHRRQIGRMNGSSFYRWIKEHNFPDGYQVLCMNCQFIKKISKEEF